MSENKGALISREALVAEAARLYGVWNLAMAAADGRREINMVYKKQELCKAVAEVAKSIPAVDAVEVVRCKDCVYYKEGELLAPKKFCFRLRHPYENRYVGYNYAPDDFCTYGERKDGADNGKTD